MTLRSTLTAIACGSLALVVACSSSTPTADPVPPETTQPFVTVLGVAQDGGSPHIGCDKSCCRALWDRPEQWRRVASLGIVDPVSSERWLVEATPDLPDQLHALLAVAAGPRPASLAGVLVTHAHIGHYPGLMYFGREAQGADGVPVFAMPRMATFLETNGPWNQLVRLGNIRIVRLEDGGAMPLNDRITVHAFTVPHRDEYSETVGYHITGPDRSVLFIPDVDKWDTMAEPIEDLVRDVDVAYLDGTFFDIAELPDRDMSEIPHPFIVESLERFAGLPAAERAKIRFIHLNHSNPALDPESAARRRILDAGMAVAERGERFGLASPAPPP
jgi:pyrroloquinoline quinone biosynthesis protein B